MALTTEQKIAQAEARLARLRTRSRKLENGQKIIVGGMVIAAARRDPAMARMLFSLAQRSMREIDRKRLAPLLEELAALHTEPLKGG
jgi:hypothetical protein